MSTMWWVQAIVVGLVCLAVLGIGAGSVIFSYAEEIRARRERRELARVRRQAKLNKATNGQGARASQADWLG